MTVPPGWTVSSDSTATVTDLSGPDGVFVQLAVVSELAGYSLDQYFPDRLTQFQHQFGRAQICAQQVQATLDGTNTPNDGRSMDICFTRSNSDGSTTSIESHQTAGLLSINGGSSQLLLSETINFPPSLSRTATLGDDVAPVVESIKWRALSSP